MLAGTDPSIFGAGTFLFPAQANGNDSYVVSLLHFDAPDAKSGTAYFIDSAYGAPLRKNAWYTLAGSPTVIATNNLGSHTGTFGPQNANSAIACPHANDLIPLGDFTIDFWLAIGSTTGSSWPIAKSATATIGPYLFGQSAGTVYFYASSNGSAWDIASGIAIGNFTANIYYHVAVTRQGSTWRLFFNGTLANTFTSSLPLFQNTEPLVIGGSPSVFANCYVDEFRFSNGIARWTAAFTPPNQPYFAQLNQGGNDEATKLLLHFDHDVVDVAIGTLNPHLFTNYGTGFDANSFNTTLGYNTLYTAAAGQRITCPDNTDLALNSANFTIDLWYFRLAAVNGDIISKRATNTDISPYVILESSGSLYFFGSYTGSAYDLSALLILSGAALNTWYHIAVVRNGPLLTFYVNGTQTLQTNIGTNKFWTNSSVLSIGGNTTASVTGYIEEVRISKCARWTANFTVSPATPVYSPNLDTLTRLLMHFDGASGSTAIVDNSRFGISRGNALLQNGAPALSNTNIKFGNASLLCNGSSNIAFVAPTTDFDFYNLDFTIDYWEYRTSAATGGAVVGRGNPSGYGPFLVGYSDGTNLAVYISSNGTSWDVANAVLLGSISLNSWHHYALVRSGTTFKTYKDGVQQATFSSSGVPVLTTYGLSIGAWFSTYMNGYIEELRISKGIARWTANFTPPTFPYDTTTDQYATKLLTHFNGLNNATTFLDSSIFNRGNGSIGVGSPKLSTVKYKFSGASLILDGSSGINFPASTEFDYANDYTIEAWVNLSARAASGTLSMICSRTGSTEYWLFYVDETGVAAFGLLQASVYTACSNATTIPLNTWTHLAFTRLNGIGTLYVNGVGSTPLAFPTNTAVVTGPLCIGCYSNGAHFYTGNIDELRITNGIARWTGNFQPPALPYS
jgi:Concanavalin A-like lectin/glucanases superfamily